MNITEANAWNHVLEGLRTAADSDATDRAIEAAGLLTERANKALHAGPRPREVQTLVSRLLDAVETASFEGVEVELGDRTITTPAIREDIL